VVAFLLKRWLREESREAVWFDLSYSFPVTEEDGLRRSSDGTGIREEEE
jgi:hypothetical protein